MKRRHPLLALVMAAGTAAASTAAASTTAFAASDAAYTSAQATNGQAVYSQQCAGCHGSDLQGGVGPALKGGSFQQMAAAQQLTGASLLAVISESMPKTNPGSLSAAQYDEITAYILKQNGYPAGNTKLSAGSQGAKTLSLAGTQSGSH